MLADYKRTDLARHVLERQSVPTADFLAPDIYDSWMRCISLGLDARTPPPPEVVSPTVLRYEQQKCSLVRGLALAEMHTLHQQIAGSNFMIAFATPDGLLLDIVCDESFSRASDAASIRPGTLWAEAHCGTNGLGTAAHLKRSIVVHGSEHFFLRYANLTCAASPIFAPDGSLVGILDASSDCLSRQAHTQALVTMAATQIENGLFRENHRGSILIAFHNRGEYLHTLSAGLLAIDRDGQVLAANQAARAQLHGLPIAPGRRFSDIFRTNFSVFIDEGRKNERQKLQDDVGSNFVALVENPPQFPMRMVPQAAIPKPRAPAMVAPTFVSDDPKVAVAMRQAEAAALRKMPILIRGETGTGKEQLARYAHLASGRSGPFIGINCAALPDSLIEAELFGYADGSFTGARKGGAVGLLLQADGGTLFLDEIGDMPVVLQAVLLRFLDDWTVRPVGGVKREVDVFLVSATNANLDQLIAQGRFREDLHYRLNSLELTLPPLRQRCDLAKIARYLLGLIDKDAELTEEAIGALQAQYWPGNIRQLRNLMSRLTLDKAGERIDAQMIASHGFMPPRQAKEAKIYGETALEGSHLKTELHDLQHSQIMATFSETGNNVSKTARRLGISRNTVYRALRSN